MGAVNAHGGEWGYWPHPSYIRDHCLSRRQARSMSRRFAGVGVHIAASRLREIASGADTSGAERADVDFAVLASESKRAARIAKVEHIKRDCVYVAVVTVVGLVMLGFLLSVAMLVLSMAAHTMPLTVVGISL